MKKSVILMLILSVLLSFGVMFNTASAATSTILSPWIGRLPVSKMVTDTNNNVWAYSTAGIIGYSGSLGKGYLAFYDGAKWTSVDLRSCHSSSSAYNTIIDIKAGSNGRVYLFLQDGRIYYVSSSNTTPVLVPFNNTWGKLVISFDINKLNDDIYVLFEDKTFVYYNSTSNTTKYSTFISTYYSPCITVGEDGNLYAALGPATSTGPIGLYKYDKISNAFSFVVNITNNVNPGSYVVNLYVKATDNYAASVSYGYNGGLSTIYKINSTIREFTGGIVNNILSFNSTYYFIVDGEAASCDSSGMSDLGNPFDEINTASTKALPTTFTIDNNGVIYAGNRYNCNIAVYKNGSWYRPDKPNEAIAMGSAGSSQPPVFKVIKGIAFTEAMYGEFGTPTGVSDAPGYGVLAKTTTGSGYTVLEGTFPETISAGIKAVTINGKLLLFKVIDKPVTTSSASVSFSS